MVETKALGKTEITSLLLLQENKLYPLVPDIIGKFFTLTVLNEYIHAPEARQMFIQSARNEEGFFFLSFLLRLAEDELDSINEIDALFLFDDSSVLWEIRLKKIKKLTLPLKTDVLKLLYQEHPDVVVDLFHAMGLANLSTEQQGEALLDTVALLHEHAGRNPHSVEIVGLYAEGLANLSTEQEGEALLDTVALLGELAVSRNRGGICQGALFPIDGARRGSTTGHDSALRRT